MNDFSKELNSDTKIQLSAEEFMKIWKGEYLNDPQYELFYKNGNLMVAGFGESVCIAEKSIVVTFSNIEVTGDIFLDQEIEYLPIGISDSIFNGHFHILKGTFKNFLIGLSGGENIFKNALTILGGIFENHTQLFSIGSNAKSTSVIIGGGVFKTKLTIWYSTFVGLFVSGGSFQKGLSIQGVYEEIKIIGGEYFANLEIDRIFCRNDFQIIGGYFSKTRDYGYEWYHDERPKFTKFVDCGIVRLGLMFVYGDLIISNVDCKYINLGLNFKYAFSFINNLHIIEFNKSLNIQLSYENTLFINKLCIENATLLTGNVFKFENFNIGHLTLDNVIAQGNIYLRDLKGGFEYDFDYKSHLDAFSQNEVIYPSGEKVLKKECKSEFKIISSDLGNSNFLSCDFSNFRLIFNSSKIENIYLVGTSFPKEVDSLDDKDLRQKKNAYSQLKKVFEKNDVQTSSDYLTREIETYRKILDTKGWNFEDRLVLLLNKLTSNHGTSWSRTLFCILIFNLISFSILLRSLGFTFDLNESSRCTFIDLLSYIITYLNPIHRNDFLSSYCDKCIKWNFCSEFIDSVSKLINAFLIYQFIQAFRKFGKK